jgi:hypothetical protein
MTKVKMIPGWAKKVSYPDLMAWLVENIKEGEWNFETTHPFDDAPTFTFVDEDDAITFKLKFGL